MDPLDQVEIAGRRRRRLMIVLACAALALTAIVVAGLLIPVARRQRYFGILCMSLVYVSALPLAVSLLQFAAVGLNRFRIGYERLRPHYPRVAVVVPAWNEASVIGATIEQLLGMDYPGSSVRVYVVDDASTDETPDVVQTWVAREPDRVHHLRRERGGQGKAHTLNHGIARILADPWAEAVLIIDADVQFEPSALRKMARHLSNPDVGAVTAYIKEGSVGGNYLTRYIAYEYITAQAAVRRAQNVFGVMVCLAGGAQLHSRESLLSIGGRIDTTTLAEDTVTTFRTQLSGKRVVFEGNAIVWAEEPGDLDGLWKQRLRWARGNVQISLQYSHMWLRGRRRYGKLGQGLFSLIWFTVVLMPVFTIAASAGLVGLALMDAPTAWSTFRLLWTFHAVAFVLSTAMSCVLDPPTARRAWLQGLLFPGVISLGIIIYTMLPGAVWRAAGRYGAQPGDQHDAASCGRAGVVPLHLAHQLDAGCLRRPLAVGPLAARDAAAGPDADRRLRDVALGCYRCGVRPRNPGSGARMGQNNQDRKGGDAAMSSPRDWDSTFREDLAADAANEHGLFVKELISLAIIAMLVALRARL